MCSFSKNYSFIPIFYESEFYDSHVYLNNKRRGYQGSSSHLHRFYFIFFYFCEYEALFFHLISSDFDLNNNIDPDDNHFSELHPSLEGDINSQNYDSNSFKVSQPSSPCENFSVFHLNVNSLGGKRDKFLIFYQLYVTNQMLFT